MMDANFERAKGQAGRYLSVADATALFVERRLPLRIRQARKAPNGDLVRDSICY
jgi:hypothetical protein